MANPHGHIQGADARKQVISSAQLQSRFNSKKECYQFLVQECGAYLSSYHTITIWHLR
jgi:hypothetical protein